MVSWRPACTLVVFSSAVTSQNVGSDCSNLDQTSLMQDRTQSSVALETHSMDLDGSGREHSMTTMMESATNLIRMGVTPDVEEFVKLTQQEITNTIQLVNAEHQVDQDSIDSALLALTHLVGNYTAYLEQDHTNTVDDRADKSLEHQKCRYEEALQCTRSRRCQWELEELWDWVEVKEFELRETHNSVDHLWCLATEEDRALLEPVLNDSPFDWAKVFPYPTITLDHGIVTFRADTVTHFTTYKTRLVAVQAAWAAYTSKVTECATHVTQLDDKVAKCDELQENLDEAACTHGSNSRTKGKDFGSSWSMHMDTYQQAKSSGYLKQEDRKREYETLEIIDCLLTVIYTRVARSVEEGIPCITETSNPDETNHDIDTCHQITLTLTDHLTLVNGTAPVLPEPPRVDPIMCSPAYIALEYSSFPLSGVFGQDTYNLNLSNIIDASYEEHVSSKSSFETEIGVGGWPGCAAPRVCNTCDALLPTVPDSTITDMSHVCKFHEAYLNRGESDLDSFRCLNGECIPYGARCNGNANCHDGSDELFCNTPYQGPAIMDENQVCPDPDLVSMDHLFKCGGGLDGQCTSAASQCNEGKNCGVQDAACGSDDLVVEVVSTSGRAATVRGTIWVEPQQVFHDRDYTFTSHGSFGNQHGYTYIRVSNDDKDADDDHVVFKVTIDRPVTFYVVLKVTGYAVDLSQWLSDGWKLTSMVGPAYSGSPPTSPHSEWRAGLPSATVIDDEAFNPGTVYQQTFPAGVVNLPGWLMTRRSNLLFLKQAWTKREEDCWVPGTNIDDYTAEDDDGRAQWMADRSGNANSWRWCGISQEECQDSCERLGGCQAIFYTVNRCCFPSKKDFVGGDQHPGGRGGYKVSRQR